MGLLVDGQWNTDWYDTKSTGGEFEIYKMDSVDGDPEDQITDNTDVDISPYWGEIP